MVLFGWLLNGFNWIENFDSVVMHYSRSVYARSSSVKMLFSLFVLSTQKEENELNATHFLDKNSLRKLVSLEVGAVSLLLAVYEAVTNTTIPCSHWDNFSRVCHLDILDMNMHSTSD